MKIPGGLLRLVGHMYNAIYKLPGIGEPIVRGASKSIAFMNSLMPGGRKRAASVDEFRSGFAKFGKLAGLDYEFGPQDESSIVILVHRCPYGWDSPGHHGVCDAAMDMDRKMVGYAGMALDIQERVVDGAPACRLLVTRQ